jgi:hypothetical protein
MTAAARVTKGARRKCRNANNFLTLFRAIVVGGDRFVVAASKAGSIASSKAGQVGRSRRRRLRTVEEEGARVAVTPPIAESGSATGTQTADRTLIRCANP